MGKGRQPLHNISDPKEHGSDHLPAIPNSGFVVLVNGSWPNVRRTANAFSPV